MIFGRDGMNFPGLARITAGWIAGEPAAVNNPYHKSRRGSPVPEYNGFFRNFAFSCREALGREPSRERTGIRDM
jgi:hypothetical protein